MTGAYRALGLLPAESGGRWYRNEHASRHGTGTEVTGTYLLLVPTEAQ